MAEIFPRMLTIFFLQEFNQWIHNFREQNQSRFSLLNRRYFWWKNFNRLFSFFIEYF